MNFFNLKIDDNFAFLEFDQPDSKVNILSSAAMAELEKIIFSLKNNTELKGLLISSSKPDIFIAGADIKEIENIIVREEGIKKAYAGQKILNDLENLPFPTIALINGACLGGGCELALACDYRIAAYGDKVKIGLPEVKLGVIPGFGGTKRLPRLTGLKKGLELIVAGKLVGPEEAYKIGLVDGITTLNLLRGEGLKFLQKNTLRQSADGGKRKVFKPKIKGFLNWSFEKTYIGRLLLQSQFKKITLKNTKGFYPAPISAIDVVFKNYSSSLKSSLNREANAFGELVIGNVSKNLISLFFLQEKYKKEKWVDANPKTINKCGILGAGIMGGGIAQIFSYYGLPTRMKDINYASLGLGLKSAKKVYDDAVKKRKIRKPKAIFGLGLISPTLDYSGFKNCDLIVEAVVEDLKIKQKVFEELSNIAKEDAILTTNTSCIPISKIAQNAKNPSRILGLHFFNPVHRMPLVEIIRSESTDENSIATMVQFSKKIGKTPIVVKDSWGFLINRLLIPSLLEAGLLLEEGVDFEKIDHVMEKFGMPMGPFTLLDEIGIDTGYKVAKLLEENLSQNMKVPGILKDIYEKKWWGKKSSIGFYVHKNKTRIPNKGIVEFMHAKNASINDDEILNRIICRMLSESVRCLEEKICQSASDIDMGMIMGAGFPPFRGGLLRYGDSLNHDKILNDLAKIKDKSSREKFEPFSAYYEFLKNNGRFY